MYYWMHGIDELKKRETFELLQSKAIKSVVSIYDEETISLAQEFEIDLYIFSFAYGMGELFTDESYLAEDIHGKKCLWFGSTCPNKEQVRKHNVDTVKKWSSHKGVKGIFLDAARFASPVSGPDFNVFFTCFCRECEQKANFYGFDFKRMKKDVEKLYNDLMKRDPDCFSCIPGCLDMITFFQSYRGVLDWLDFRRICTTEHILNVSTAVKGRQAGSRMGIYIFTPSLAGLVGQNYMDLKEHIDIFSPMIYRSYEPGVEEAPACLNHELARLGVLIGGSAGRNANIIRLISALTGYDFQGFSGEYNIKQGLPVSCIGMETKKARTLLGRNKLLIPIIQLEDDMLEQSIDEVKQGGADGVNFFHYDRKKVLDLK